MRLTADESRALGFIALLLALSAAARVIDRPKPLETDLAAVDAGALEEAARAARDGGNRPSPLASGETIDPNNARADELMRLPRVGRALADRIIADRVANGDYRSLADLDRVSGVGPATLESWAPHIALPRERPGGASTSRPGTGATGAGSVARPSAAGQPPSGIPTGAPARGAPPRTSIDINRATAAELERVPGIGPALAARIIEHRESIGRFTRLEQLVDVRGIGEATLARMRPYLRVGS